MATTTSRRSSRQARSTNGRSPDPKLSVRAPQIQPFGTLRKLPIGLPDAAEVRARSVRSLVAGAARSMRPLPDEARTKTETTIAS